MSKIIDTIIEEKIKKNNIDKEFYEGCRNNLIESEKKGCDFSDCKNFSDLCNKNNKFFLDELLKGE